MLIRLNSFRKPKPPSSDSSSVNFGPLGFDQSSSSPSSKYPPDRHLTRRFITTNPQASSCRRDTSASYCGCSSLMSKSKMGSSDDSFCHLHPTNSLAFSGRFCHVLRQPNLSHPRETFPPLRCSTGTFLSISAEQFLVQAMRSLKLEGTNVLLRTR